MNVCICMWGANGAPALEAEVCLRKDSKSSLTCGTDGRLRLQTVGFQSSVSVRLTWTTFKATESQALP